MGTGKNKKIEEKKEKRETERQRDSQGTIAFSNYFYIFYLDWNIYIYNYLFSYLPYLSIVHPACQKVPCSLSSLGWVGLVARRVVRVFSFSFKFFKKVC